VKAVAYQVRQLGGIGLACVLIASLSGCASAPPREDAEAYAAYQEANDPFEPVNRVIFEFNLVVDRILLRPLALGYRTVVPTPVRSSVTSFFDNLESPVILLNDVLQVKPQRAGITVARFVVNTAVGFFGFFDPADGMGLPRHDEDFAQTLGYWGVGEGPYLMLPILGPLPPRDALGFIADSFSDPLYYILDGEHITGDDKAIYYGYQGADLIDKRHQVLDEVDEMQKTSVDFYAAVRSLYRQTVNDEIRDGKQDPKNMPDFDYTSDNESSGESDKEAQGDQAE